MRKNPNDVGANYVNSIWFSRPINPDYQPDSAYTYALKAQQHFLLLTNAQVNRLAKDDITEQDINAQKIKMDSLGFELAQKTNTEKSYQLFLDKYATAHQRNLARDRRNAIAFAEAQRINTYDSYKHFLDKYPDAQQAQDAKEVYHLLIYESKTSSGKITDLEVFVRENIGNPYRSRTEQRIYEIYAAPHTIESYQQYLKKHSQTQWSARAAQWLDFLTHDKSQVFYPFIEKSKYGFQNEEGSTELGAQYDSIPEIYRCKGVKSDFLTVFKRDKAAAINTDNQQICPYKFDNISDLGKGILKVKQNGMFGTWSKAGYELLPPDFSAIDTLNKHLLVVSKGRNKGIYSMQGILLLPALYDDILWEAGRIILVKQQKKAFLTEQQLLSTLQKQVPKINFAYDELYESHDTFMIARVGNLLGLLNEKNELVVPIHATKIEETAWGWTVQQNNRFYWLDKQGHRPSADTYEKLLIGKDFHLAKQNGRWGVLWANGLLCRDFDMDSVRFLSPRIIWGLVASKIYISFGNGQWADFSAYRAIETLTNAGFANGEASYFLLAHEANGKQLLLNAKGKILNYANYEKIEIISSKWLTVKQKGLSGIADTSGKILLAAQYDGIGNTVGNNINILKDGKFGLFNPVTQIRIPTLYKASLEPYLKGIALYIAIAQSGKYGLIDQKNKPIIPFAYDEIRFWKKNIALVRQDKNWCFFDINTRKPTQYGIFENPVIVWQSNEMQIMKVRKQGVETLWSNSRDMPFAFVELEIRNLAGNETEEAFFLAASPIDVSGNYSMTYFNLEGHILREQILSEIDYDRIVCDGVSPSEANE